MNIDYLANQPEYLPTLARWYYDEWAYLNENTSLESLIAVLEGYLNTDELPLLVLAYEQKTLLGAAQLKFREMSIYPDKEHWLGGVYVAPDYRNNGIAEKVIKQVYRSAQQFGVRTLHLQTADLTGGLYKRMGWKPIETVNNGHFDVLVMERAVVD